MQYKGTIIKNGVMLWPVGTDGAKRHIYHRLKTTEPGPGCMHFPIGLPDEYHEQLTAEKLVTRYKHGVPYGEWIQARPRNEALDCEVYAYAAAIRAGMGKLDWARLEQALVLRAGSMNENPPMVPPAVTAQPTGRRVRSRGIETLAGRPRFGRITRGFSGKRQSRPSFPAPGTCPRAARCCTWRSERPSDSSRRRLS